MSHNRQHRKSYNLPGHAHELTFSCFKRLKLLSKDRTCIWLAEAIQDACQSLGLSLWAYVFMPNHVHLIIHPNQTDYKMSDILKSIKLPVSRRSIAWLRETNPDWLEHLKQERGERSEYHFWQRGGGYDRNITEPETLMKMIDYIHMNPVRSGDVERSREWKWSSAGWFEGGVPNDLPVDPIPPEWLME